MIMGLTMKCLLIRWRMTTTEKTCFKCGNKKRLDCFYKHSRMADGHLNKCKECTKFDANNHRNENIERVRAYDRSRGNRQSKEYSRNYIRNNPEKKRESIDRYTNNNQDRKNSHATLGNALRDGRIIRQPCQVCGNEKSEGHHPDYSKPLEVKWLCKKHHMAEHRRLNEIERIQLLLKKYGGI